MTRKKRCKTKSKRGKIKKSINVSRTILTNEQKAHTEEIKKRSETNMLRFEKFMHPPAYHWQNYQFSRNEEKPQAEPTTEPIVGFPPNQLKNWNQVKFCALTEKFSLEVNVDGEPFLVSELMDNGLSKGHLAFLFNIVLKNGFFDKDSFPEIKNISLYVRRLNESLQKIFRINQKPISYKQKAKSYQAAFQTELDPSI